MKSSRRDMVKKIAGLAVSMPVADQLTTRMTANEAALEPALKGRVNHSVCRWCYSKIDFEDLCKASKSIGLTSIELTGPEEWPIMKKYDLYCAMPWGAGKGINDGFNDPKLHDELIASYEAHFPKLAAAGFDKVICFSGNRRGMSDELGLENCAKGLQRLMKSAEKHKVTMVMELLNSKVNHTDYMCDHFEVGRGTVQESGQRELQAALRYLPHADHGGRRDRHH